MEKKRNWFFVNGVLILGQEGPVETNTCFPDGGQLAKFLDKTSDKYHDHPFIYHTGGSLIC